MITCLILSFLSTVQDVNVYEVLGDAKRKATSEL